MYTHLHTSRRSAVGMARVGWFTCTGRATIQGTLNNYVAVQYKGGVQYMTKRIFLHFDSICLAYNTRPYPLWRIAVPFTSTCIVHTDSFLGMNLVNKYLYVIGTNLCKLPTKLQPAKVKVHTICSAALYTCGHARVHAREGEASSRAAWRHRQAHVFT